MADLTRLIALCTEATDADTAQLLQEEADAALEAAHAAKQMAEMVFGDEAAQALGEWRPTDAPPKDTVQAYARLTPDVYVRFTAPPSSTSRFDVAANCDACGGCKETAVRSLTELALALFAAGVSR